MTNPVLSRRTLRELGIKTGLSPLIFVGFIRFVETTRQLHNEILADSMQSFYILPVSKTGCPISIFELLDGLDGFGIGAGLYRVGEDIRTPFSALFGTEILSVA